MVSFTERGWVRFDHDPVLAEWVKAVRPAALATVGNPEFAEWHRNGGTWFAGVNALPNDATGAVAGSGPLVGAAAKFVRLNFGSVNYDRAQVSVVWPGYPRQGSESDAAFDFRLRRDAAHVDGLKRVGPERRRMIREPQAFVLGIPLTDCDAGASPMVVWEGSHTIIGPALAAAVADHPPEVWNTVDVTDAYAAARRQVFATCKRVAVPARVGQAYLIHRHLLHGVSPWQAGATAPPEGRMIAYFRPAVPSVADWFKN